MDKGVGIEKRDLNQFGQRYFIRAAGYLNAISLAASQDRVEDSSARNKGRNACTNKITCSTDTDKKIKRPFCFNCEADHPLVEGKKFKDLTVLARLEFVSRHKLYFPCLRPNHSSRYCRSGKGCNVTGCHFKHHQLLHEASTTPPERGAVAIPQFSLAEDSGAAVAC